MQIDPAIAEAFRDWVTGTMLWGPRLQELFHQLRAGLQISPSRTPEQVIADSRPSEDAGPMFRIGPPSIFTTSVSATNTSASGLYRTWIVFSP